MPWVDPRTWVTDEFITAAMLNTSWRDNIGSSFREIESINQASNIGSGATWGVGNGTVVIGFASRTYPGYPVEIKFHTPSAFTGFIAITDGTPGSSGSPVMGSTGKAGTMACIFTPAPGVHNYKIAIWQGTVNGPSQGRLLEKAGPA